jgi:hypothetical protein
MYSMWEVHQLVSTHHDELVREADRERLRQQALAQAASRQGSQGRAASNRWERLAALVGHWCPRRPAAARR